MDSGPIAIFAQSEELQSRAATEHNRVTGISTSQDFTDTRSPKAFVRLIRPHQWVKNLFVLGPLLFSGRALQPDAQLKAALAFVMFCLLASSVYVFNDLVDREADRAHPVKRFRPIASGAVKPTRAWAVAFACLASSLIIAASVGRGLLLCAIGYVGLNVAYSLRLKHVVILDVFTIAAFFILRLLAGAAAVSVRPSVWLLLCGGLLALYLGFAKRRHELVLLGSGSGAHRTVLAQYTTGFLDQLSAVLLAVLVVSYIMYTIESETALLVGGERLSYSSVFVLYGVLRYLYLVNQSLDANPTDTLLTDRGLLTACVLWAVYCAAVVYAPLG